MKTKILLSALCLPVVFAACTSEEILENSVVSQMPVGREVVQLNVTADVDSRMTMENGLFVWEETDKVGSVLVDAVSLFTVGGPTAIIGNNRWDYVNNSFTTQGTTVEGAWLFYYPYDEAVSKRGNGIKVTKSIQYQEYDPDGKKMAANDFRVSPVYFMNAAEGGAANINVQFNSVYSYGIIDATFPTDVIVDKVLIKAEGGNKFNDKLTVVPANVAGEASMNYAKTLVDNELVPTTLNVAYKQMWADEEAEPVDKVPSINKAIAGLQDWSLDKDYNEEGMNAIVTADSQIDYILIDCGDEGVATTSNKFYTNVLFPADMYTFEYDVYFYTNNGVYKYTVDNDVFADDKAYYKRGAWANLHNVNRVAEFEVGVGQYAIAPTTIAATTKAVNPYIIENKDLVSYINSITTTQPITPNVLGTVTIDDAVVAALNANDKVTSMTINLPNIDVTCGTQNISKLISANGVTLKSGANVTFKGGSIKNLTIEEGATATLEKNVGASGAVTTVKGTLNIANTVGEYVAYVDMQGGILNIGTAVANDVPTIIGYLRNIESGELNINVNYKNNNAGGDQDAVLGLTTGTTTLNATINGIVTLNGKNIILNATANLTNNGTLVVAENNGTITNNGTLTVTSNEANAVINNYGIATVTTNKVLTAAPLTYYGYINQLSDDAELECDTNNGIIETLYEKAEATIGINNGEIIVKDIARVKYTTNNGDITYSAPETIQATDFSTLDNRITKIIFNSDFTYTYGDGAGQAAAATLNANVKNLVFKGDLTLGKAWALNAGSSVSFIGAEANIKGNNALTNVETLSFGVAEVKIGQVVVVEKVATDGFIAQGTTISDLVNVNFYGGATVWNNGTVNAVTATKVNLNGVSSLVVLTKADGWKGEPIK